MRRLAAASLLFLGIALLSAAPAHATDHCQFTLGFKALRDLLGHYAVGECWENAHYNANGDAEQRTSGGMLVWRKADNLTAFTDGARTWINGPNGIEGRINWQRFPWEPDYRPEIAATPIPLPPRAYDFRPAFALLRSTARGEELYQQSLQSGVGITLGFLQHVFLVFDASSNRIVIRHGYHKDHLSRITALMAYGIELARWTQVHGNPTTLEQCTQREYLARTASHMWQLENGTQDFPWGFSWGATDAERYSGAQAYTTYHFPVLCPAVPRGAPQPAPSPVPVQPTPRPQPTAVPPPTIDPKLAQAYQVMRRTETGSKVADRFAQLQASAVFGELDDSLSRWEHSPRRITIDYEYRNASPEALAYILIWPTLWLDFYYEFGEIESWDACIAMEYVATLTQIRYWLQAFGKNGKRNPAPGPETWANSWIELFVKLGNEESLLNWMWMLNSQREYCEYYGAPPQHIDPALADAYRTAMFNADIGVQAVSVIMESGADVVFEQLPASVYGRYYGSRNRIAVSEALRGQSDVVLVAVLIHETYHAQQQVLRGGYQETAAECLQEEVDAFRLEAKWWYEQYGRYGKRNPNRVERRFNNLMQAWLNRGLREWVLLSEGYQEQCLGGVVR